MIKLNVVAVGKLKEKFWVDAIAEYRKRIGRYAELNVIECPEGIDEGNAEKLQKAEEGGILKKLKGYVVLLAIDGEQLSSEDLASFIDKTSARGISEFSFIIGGSRGVSEEIRKRANKAISFGKATYPHQLMRVILLEALYRSFTILAGKRYHK